MKKRHSAKSVTVLQALLLSVLMVALPTPNTAGNADPVTSQDGKNTTLFPIETVEKKIADIDKLIKQAVYAENEQTALQLGVSLKAFGSSITGFKAIAL